MILKKSRKWLVLLVFLSCLGAMLVLSSVQAQAPASNLVIDHVEIYEAEEAAVVSLYFTALANGGRPLPQPTIESIAVHLTDSHYDPVGAEIVDPGTPVYVVLILDVSSGMANVIDDMRRAAETAVDSAHANVYFAVMQFDTTWQLLQPFSNNANQVKAAILQAAASSGAGACLYNTLYAGFDLLAQQPLNPQDRQAIFLFASGKDQRAAHNNEPCSIYAIDQVIAYAQHQGEGRSAIPIHTIGLFDQTRGNLDQQNLQRLADETKAFSAIGGSSQLGDLFQEIIGGLSSQLVARASVPAQAGNNQGQLILANRNGAVIAQAGFSFTASQSYAVASNNARVDISSVQYYSDRNSYELRLNVANPEVLSQLVVSVWDTRGGVQIGSDYTFANPSSLVIANIDARNFDAEREYAFRVQAVDQAGFLIEGERGGTVLVERNVQHRPETAEPVSFIIQSVNVDRENSLLTIMLDVSEMSRVGWYDGFIVDESGQEVARFAQTSFPGSPIAVDLPVAIETAVQQHRYTLNLYLYTHDGLRSEQTREFTPPLPARPGFFARIWLGLTSNPFILISIIIIVASVSAWLYLRNKNKSKKDTMPRPPVDMTMVIEQTRKRPPQKRNPTPQQNKPSPSTPSMPSLYMELQESPSLQKIPRRATTFPYTIGREECDLNIVGDRRISRQHLRISHKQGSLYITDLGSSNGTYLDGNKLTPLQDTLLSGKHELRLGSKTTLNVEIGK